MSSKSIVCPTTSNLSPKIKWYENLKISLKFNRSCLKQDKRTFTLSNRVNMFIASELDAWSRDLNKYFTLKDCLFGTVKLTLNPDPEKYSYYGFGVKFDSCIWFFIPNFGCGKNIIIFRIDNSSSV